MPDRDAERLDRKIDRIADELPESIPGSGCAFPPAADIASVDWARAKMD